MFISRFKLTGTVKGGRESNSMQRLKNNSWMQHNVTDLHLLKPSELLSLLRYLQFPFRNLVILNA